MGTELLLIWINKLSYTYPHYCLDLEDKTTEKKCGWTGGAALRTWVWVRRGGDAMGVALAGRKGSPPWGVPLGRRRWGEEVPPHALAPRGEGRGVHCLACALACGCCALREKLALVTGNAPVTDQVLQISQGR
jgi:hypothetical protein